jgi:hypothetical protein
VSWDAATAAIDDFCNDHLSEGERRLVVSLYYVGLYINEINTDHNYLDITRVHRMM